MVNKKLYRMVLDNPSVSPRPYASFDIEPYSRSRHHNEIRRIYGEAFEKEPWPESWDSFEEFDPKGIFLAQDSSSRQWIGFVVSFERDGYGYISVVAVIPPFQRRGIASALVRKAIEYFRSLHLRTVKIDAYVESTAAVETYKSLGFVVESTFDDRDPTVEG